MKQNLIKKMAKAFFLITKGSYPEFSHIIDVSDCIEKKL